MSAVKYLKYVERHWIQGKDVTDWMDKLSEMTYSELLETRDILSRAMEVAPSCYEDDIHLLIKLSNKFMIAALERMASHKESPPPYNPEETEYETAVTESPKRPMTVLEAHHARIAKSSSPWAIFTG